MDNWMNESLLWDWYGWGNNRRLTRGDLPWMGPDGDCMVVSPVEAVEACCASDLACVIQCALVLSFWPNNWLLTLPHSPHMSSLCPRGSCTPAVLLDSGLSLHLVLPHLFGWRERNISWWIDAYFCFMLKEADRRFVCPHILVTHMARFLGLSGFFVFDSFASDF